MLRCIRCGIRTCSYLTEESAIRLRLHFEEIANLLIAVQVAIGVDYYERRGPIRTDKIVCVIWKSSVPYSRSATIVFFFLTTNLGSQNTSDRRRGVQSWFESLHHSDP